MKLIKARIQYSDMYCFCSRNSGLQPAFVHKREGYNWECAMHNDICVMTSISNALGITNGEKKKKSHQKFLFFFSLNIPLMKHPAQSINGRTSIT